MKFLSKLVFCEQQKAHCKLRALVLPPPKCGITRCLGLLPSEVERRCMLLRELDDAANLEFFFPLTGAAILNQGAVEMCIPCLVQAREGLIVRGVLSLCFNPFVVSPQTFVITEFLTDISVLI